MIMELLKKLPTKSDASDIIVVKVQTVGSGKYTPAANCELEITLKINRKEVTLYAYVDWKFFIYKVTEQNTAVVGWVWNSKCPQKKVLGIWQEHAGSGIKHLLCLKDDRLST